MRDNEDIKYRVIRDSLKLKNITVLTTERLESKFSSKPGIVKTTLDSVT